MFRHQLTILRKSVWTSFGVAAILVAGSVDVQAASIFRNSFTFGDESNLGIPETIKPVTETEFLTPTTDSTLNITNAPIINASSYNGATIIANTTLKIENDSTLSKKINTANGVNVTLEGGEGKSVTIQDSNFAENSNVTFGGSSNYYAASGSAFKGNITIGENASFEIGSASQTENNHPFNVMIHKAPQALSALNALNTSPASFQNGYSAQNDSSVLNQAGVIDVNGNVRIDGRLVVNVKNGQVDAINVEGEIGLGENFKFVVMVDSYDDYAGMEGASILNGDFDVETLEMLEGLMENGDLKAHVESENGNFYVALQGGALLITDAALVPEPATWVLLALGALGLGFFRKRK